MTWRAVLVAAQYMVASDKIFTLSRALVKASRADLPLALPRPYTMIVFPYRLESYVILETSGAVLAGLALAHHSSRQARRWAWTLVPVLIVAIVGAVQQTSAYPNGLQRPRSRAGTVLPTEHDP